MSDNEHDEDQMAPPKGDQPSPQFLKSLLSLPSSGGNTLRFFDRRDYFSCHGEDAVIFARDYYKTLASLKFHKADAEVVKLLGGNSASASTSSAASSPGLTGSSVPYVNVSKALLSTSVGDLVLRRGWRAEVYEWSQGGLKLLARASPGDVAQMEDFLGPESSFSAAEHGFQPVMAAAKVASGNRVHLAYVRSSAREIGVCEFVDDDGLGTLESVLVQIGATECLVPMCTAASAIAAPTVDGASGDAQQQQQQQGHGSSAAAEALRLQKAVERSGAVWTERKGTEFSDKSCEQDIARLAGSTASALAEIELRGAMASLGALIRYLDLLSDSASLGKYTVKMLEPAEYMRLDASAVSALSLYPQAGGSGPGPQRSGKGTLFGLLNRCKTQAGARTLLRWIQSPLLDPRAIGRRQDTVGAFSEDTELRMSLATEHLPRMPDVIKILRKIERGRGSLQDAVRLYQCVSRLPDIVNALKAHEGPAAGVLADDFGTPLSSCSADCRQLLAMVEHTIDLDSLDSHEYLINPRHHPELSELSKLRDASLDEVSAEHSRVLKSLGTDARKVKLERNEVLGHYLRVSRKEASIVPLGKGGKGGGNYEQLEARKDGLRFTTARLRRVSAEYQDLGRRYLAKQAVLVKQALQVVATYGPVLERVSDLLSRLDALLAMAIAGIEAPIPYVRPVLAAGGEGSLVLRAARHPCIESQDGVSYIPNDVELTRGGQRFLVVTGPNMGGKSSYIRTAGLVTVMAHIGCFVPCASAEVPVTDKVLCRIGAGDSALRGVSTFMAEMLETGAMLRAATERSLLIIDELGRGTSTYDGFGLAWAISKDIANRVKAPCLFATHFHELTALADECAPTVGNLHVSAKVDADRLTLLYTVRPGPSDQSFGIHVARMAGFPEAVLTAAKRKAEELEAKVGQEEQGGNGENSDGGSENPEKRMVKRARGFGGDAAARTEGEAFIQQVLAEAGKGTAVEAIRARIAECDNAFVRHLIQGDEGAK